MRLASFLIPISAILVFAKTAHAQFVECALAHSGDTVTGECLGAAVELRRGVSGEAQWLGTLRVADTPVVMDVIRHGYAGGPVDVVRTPWGWFLPSKLDLEADPPQLAWSMSDEAPPASQDLQILTWARSLITSEENWDRADDRVCSPSDTTYSLYCALAEATRLVSGQYQHRQPALQVVRQVVREAWPQRVVEHRLMDFNNDSRTTYADLLAVFDRAEERLRAAIR